MAIVVLVLLIATTNLGSLLAARGTARQQEIATRLAMGATQARIVRQLLTESLMLAVAGGTLGGLFAVWGSRALIAQTFGALEASGAVAGLALDVSLDGRALLFTSVISLVAGALFGLAPAVRAVRGEAAFRLVDTSRHVVGRERRWSSRDAFMIAQIALSLVLLGASAMFIRTLQNLQGQDLGLRVADRLQVRLVSERGHRPVLATLVPELMARMRAIPGVEAASVAFNGPLSDSGSGVYGLQIDGHPPRDPEDHRARADWVGPDYLHTVGIALAAGRDFSLEDGAGVQRVAIVNETMARQFFKPGEAVGRRFTFNKDEYEIVGVAKDARYTSLRDEVPRVVYFPVLQSGTSVNALEIRTSGADPLSLANAVRSAIRDVDPRISAIAVMTLSQRLDRRLSVEHLIADLSGFFSGLTLLLVSIGVYGTLGTRLPRDEEKSASVLRSGRAAPRSSGSSCAISSCGWRLACCWELSAFS